MDETRQRLTNCFQVVFPDMPAGADRTGVDGDGGQLGFGGRHHADERH